MAKLFLLIIAGLLFTNISNLVSQQSKIPFGMSQNSNLLKPISSIETYTLSGLSIDSIYKQKISSIEENSNIYGRGYKTEKSINSSGTWDTLPNGDRLWRIRVYCPMAFTLNFVLNNVHIADNSNLSFYNEQLENYLGPYNKSINSQSGIFSSHLIPGASVIIELFEPKIDLGNNTFCVEEIVYGFKDIVSDYKEFFPNAKVNESGSCNIDANCSQGSDLCREKYSVGLILKGHEPGEPEDQWTRCTGTLLNNTRNDFTPYFLTAWHCSNDQNNVYQSFYDRWTVRFRYLKSECNLDPITTTVEYSGANYRAHSSETDFLLVELKSNLIQNLGNNLNLYFAGWDRSDIAPTSYKTLHHPKGDVMKISSSNISSEIAQYTNSEGGTNGCVTCCLKVIWVRSFFVCKFKLGDHTYFVILIIVVVEISNFFNVSQ